jgi:hypothetical protein
VEETEVGEEESGRLRLWQLIKKILQEDSNMSTGIHLKILKSILPQQEVFFKLADYPHSSLCR